MPSMAPVVTEKNSNALVTDLSGPSIIFSITDWAQKKVEVRYLSYQRQLKSRESLWPFIPGLEVKDTWKAHIIFPYYLFLKGGPSHEIMFFIFWWPIALHHCIQGAGSIVTMLCWFLLYSKVNQPHVYIYPLFLGFPSPSGYHRVLSRVPCAVLSVFIRYLLYT